MRACARQFPPYTAKVVHRVSPVGWFPVPCLSLMLPARLVFCVAASVAPSLTNDDRVPVRGWVVEVKIRFTKLHEGVIRLVSRGNEVLVILNPLEAEAAPWYSLLFPPVLGCLCDVPEVVFHDGLLVPAALFAQGFSCKSLGGGVSRTASWTRHSFILFSVCGG